MARTWTGHDDLPIYEDLVRERGDAVAEAQMAAEHTRHQAAELLTGQDAAPPLPRRYGGAEGGASGPWP